MRANVTASEGIQVGGFRLDASYHANEGSIALHYLKKWATAGLQKNKLDLLGNVCLPEGIFIGGRAKRIYVDNPAHGIPFLSSSDMLLASFDGVKLISNKQPELESLLLRQGWTLISRSGTIGNTTYVRKDMDGLAASEHIMRVVADPQKIMSGYLDAFLSSTFGVSMIRQGTFGAVVDTIAPEYIASLPVPRLESDQERHIHKLIEQAAELRFEANQHLREAQERFYREVLGIEPKKVSWKCRNEHAYSTGKTHINSGLLRLDGFHYIGYVGEAEQKLGKTIPLGDLVDPYQPSQFKRPYTDETGIPFLSGIDLFNSYPKPHMYISYKMKDLDRYLVPSGTILVQSDGSRDGLIARPTILPNHLDQCAVTQHMARLYPKDARDRGYIFIWLSTQFGRRLLLKHSSGSVMGSLFERSYRDARVPSCSPQLRYTFEEDTQKICELREKANKLDDDAQNTLHEYLGY